MTHSSSTYWVEVLENDGVWRKVWHTENEMGRHHEILLRKDAKKYRDELKDSHPDYQFRLVKLTKSYTFEKPI